MKRYEKAGFPRNLAGKACFFCFSKQYSIKSFNIIKKRRIRFFA